MRKCDFSWNIVDPPVTFKNLIEDFETMSEAARVPKTARQPISFGLQIIRHTGEFDTAIIEWNDSPVAEHTWPNFKPITLLHTIVSSVHVVALCMAQLFTKLLLQLLLLPKK